MAAKSSRRRKSRRERQRETLERLELSRGSWGWNDAETVWIPPQYAGVDADVELLGEYDPIDAAVELFRTRARFVNVLSCRRGGKTYNAIRAWVDRLLEVSDLVRTPEGDGVFDAERFDRWFRGTVGTPGAPRVLRERKLRKGKAPVPAWVVAPTYDLAEQSEGELSDIFERWRDELGVVWKGRTLWIFALGIRIDIRSAENPRRLVARGLCGVFLDEAARLKPQAFTNVLPTVNDRRGFVFAATTPDGKNAFYSELWARGDETAAKESGRAERYDPADEDAAGEPELGAWVDGTRNVAWGAESNTALPGLAEERERDIRRYGEDSLFVLQNWLYSFESPHGRIWKRLRFEKHVRRFRDVDFVERVAGFDPGYTGSAAALVFFGRTKRGHWHLYHAVYGRGVLAVPADGRPIRSSNSWARFALDERDRLAALGQSLTLYVGPDRPDIRDQFVATGLDARTADNSFRAGVATVERLVAYDADALDPNEREPLFSVSPDLDPVVWGELTGYQWATGSDGRPTGAPLKKDDHIPDAVRYALHTAETSRVEGGGQIEDYDAAAGL